MKRGEIIGLIKRHTKLQNTPPLFFFFFFFFFKEQGINKRHFCYYFAAREGDAQSRNGNCVKKDKMANGSPGSLCVLLPPQWGH